MRLNVESLKPYSDFFYVKRNSLGRVIEAQNYRVCNILKTVLKVATNYEYWKTVAIKKKDLTEIYSVDSEEVIEIKKELALREEKMSKARSFLQKNQYSTDLDDEFMLAVEQFEERLKCQTS